MSLGTPKYAGSLEETCKKAYEGGVILVASAGNNRVGFLYPAFYRWVVSVGATNRLNKTMLFSNIWPTTNIVAPGEDIFGAHIPTDKGNYESAYALGDGTSMAAAHVTGILALALSYLKKEGKKLRPEELVKIMKETAFMPNVSKGEISDLIKNAGLTLTDGSLGHEKFLNYVYGKGIISAERILGRLQ